MQKHTEPFSPGHKKILIWVWLTFKIKEGKINSEGDGDRDRDAERDAVNERERSCHSKHKQVFQSNTTRKITKFKKQPHRNAVQNDAQNSAQTLGSEQLPPSWAPSALLFDLDAAFNVIKHMFLTKAV